MDTPKYKELQLQYDNQTTEKGRIDNLVEQAMEVRNFDVEGAIQMAQDIISRSDEIDYELGKGRGLNLKGWCKWRLGEYDEGHDLLQQAYSIALDVKDKALEARVLNNFGYIYRDRGELATALNYFENAFSINETLGDAVAMAVNMSAIAYLNYDLGDYENALEFALRCLPTFQNARDIHRLTTLYHILGNIYFKLEAYHEALRYFEENLNYAEKGTVLHDLALSGVGKVYYKMQRIDEAEKCLIQSLQDAEEVGDIESQIISSFYLGRLHMDEEHYRTARKYLEKAFTLSEEYTRMHDKMSVHEILSVLYDKMGDIPKAFNHLKEFERLKEDIFKQTTFNKLRNLQVRQQVELAQKEKEVAEKTANLKQQFMANMSHEIRTPMNAIVGMTRLLQSRSPKPDQLRYLNAIQQSADTLLVIINDILDLSKIEAGKIIIEKTDFQLAATMQSLKDMMMLKAEEKGIHFETYIDPAIAPWLLGDPTRIGQILVNLAGNAMKFTEKGSVEVKATLVARHDNLYSVRFDVIDTGIGIAPDYVDKIFESFTQAGTDTARKFGGTGLGLTISRQLAALMGGEIFVHSELNKGTTFSVVLPLERADHDGQESEEQQLNSSALERLKMATVLLVEDNEFNRMVAEDTLQEVLPGIKVEVAVNGEEAVQMVTNKNYDMVLMDIQMPVMDGITATQKIRKNLPAPARNTKIIAMTANVLQEDVKRYFEIGMNAYVSKPFKTEELLEKMSQMLDEHQPEIKEELVIEPAPVVDSFKLPEQVTDRHFLQGFTNGNSEKMQKYIGMFLDNAPRLLQNIDEALVENDLASLKIAAHSLKPQLSYMGVKEEVSNIFLIEQTAGDQAHTDRLPTLVSNLKLVCEKAFEELRK